jgi:hypothetical protein
MKESGRGPASCTYVAHECRQDVRERNFLSRPTQRFEDCKEAPTREELRV